LVSCAAPPPDQQATEPLQPFATAPAASQTDTANTATSATIPGAATAAPAASSKVPATATGAMNPEHGKPGHRCDIPVGAPLSTPLQDGPQQAQPQIQPPLPSQPLPAQQSSNANQGIVRINPAHGQPGHDCAVPVGQPLN
jgi:hypothetical protein